jgi:hypothetical protein
MGTARDFAETSEASMKKTKMILHSSHGKCSLEDFGSERTAIAILDANCNAVNILR